MIKIKYNIKSYSCLRISKYGNLDLCNINIHFYKALLKNV